MVSPVRARRMSAAVLVQGPTKLLLVPVSVFVFVCLQKYEKALRQQAEQQQQRAAGASSKAAPAAAGAGRSAALGQGGKENATQPPASR